MTYNSWEECKPGFWYMEMGGFRGNNVTYIEAKPGSYYPDMKKYAFKPHIKIIDKIKSEIDKHMDSLEQIKNSNLKYDRMRLRLIIENREFLKKVDNIVNPQNQS